MQKQHDAVSATAAEPPSVARRARLICPLVGTRLRRRTRWGLRVVVAVPLLLVLSGLIALRSPLVGQFVAAEVSEKLGCQFTGQGRLLNLGHTLVIHNPRLVVPGARGEAARFMQADRAEIELDWARGLLAGPRPTRVRLFSPVFRVSVATDDGSLSLDGLGVSAGESTGPALPPIVDIVDARLELGEHSRETWAYTRLTSVPVTGELAPVKNRAEGASPAYGVRLSQTGPVTGSGALPRTGPGMLLEGQIDLGNSDAQLTLKNVSLDEWPPQVIPTVLRDVWRRLNIQGNVSEASLRYTHGAGVQTAVALDGVSMDGLVPADRPEFGGAERPLKLTGVTGTIKLSRAGIDALLQGNVGDLPGRVSLRTSGTRLDAPLRCEITTNKFNVSQSPELMPYAPRIVRKRFASFSGPTAVVDARVLIERGPPVDGGAAPLRTSGSIAFENGRAAFEKFPYPFEDLRGLVTFDDEKIEIVNIQGRGPTGAIMTAEGFIAPPNDDPEVVVDVLVLDLAVDDVLRDVMPEGWRGVIDELFNTEQYQGLLDRGLVLSPQRRSELNAQLAAARAGLGTAQDAAARSALEQKIAGLESALLAPVFELGGAAQVGVRVSRDEGEEGKFTHTVEVRLPRAGLLPEGFPLPIVARDVVLEIGEESAKVVAGTFEGLTGGKADLAATIDLRDESDRPVLRPHVTVKAEGVPVDALLLSAIPEQTDAAPADRTGSAGGISPKRLLTALNVGGMVSCEAVISPAEGERAAAGKRVSVDVTVGLDGLHAAPDAPAGADALLLGNMAGSIRVTDGKVDVQALRATLSRRSAADGAVTEAGAIEMGAVAALVGDGSLSAGITARDLDVSAPLERLVALVSARAGDTVARIRQKQRTSGRVDAHIDLSQEGAAPVAIGVRVDGARGLEFDALGGRVGVSTTGGSAALRTGEALDRVSFKGLGAEVMFNGKHLASAEIDGSTPLLGSASPHADAGDANTVAVRLRGVKLDSDQSRAAWKSLLGGNTSGTATADPAKADAGKPAPAPAPSRWAWLEQLDPRGELDADLQIKPRNPPRLAPAKGGSPAADAPAPMVVGAGAGVGTHAGGIDVQANLRPGAQPDGGSIVDAPPPAKRRAIAVATSRYAVGGSIWPKALSFMRNDTLIDLPSITGRLILEENGGRFENLRAAAAQERWHVGLDGTWEASGTHANAGVKLDTVVSLAGDELDSSLRALLPTAIRAAAAKAKVKIDGPFSIDNARLAMWIPTAKPGEAAKDGGKPATRAQKPAHEPKVSAAIGAGLFLFDGTLQLTDLSASVGVPVRHGAGSVALLVQQDHGDTSPTIDVTLRSDSLAIAGVPLTGARGRLVSGSLPGQLIVPQFAADCLGGRVALSGVLDGIMGAAKGKGASGASYQVSATIVGTRFAPLLASIEAARPRKGSKPPPAVVPGDESRGRMDASFSLSGILGKDDSRVGRGSVRIAGGDVVQLPGVVRMVELSNLQVPSAERLDYVQAGFDLKGEKISFEEVAVMSESLTITGDGTITMPAMNLDFKFNSQAAAGRRIPVVSGLFEAVRNELVTTVVGGTISKPKVRTESLAGTRRMLSGIFGGDAEPEMDNKAVAKAARSERDRLRAQRPSQGTMAPTITLPGSGTAVAPRAARPQTTPKPGSKSGLSKAEGSAAPGAASGDLR